MKALPTLSPALSTRLRQGIVIPAHPLALDRHRRLDERRQRALTRYYRAAGAGGIAVAVHTTQFEIRDPRVGLLRPVLELTAETLNQEEAKANGKLIRVAGICGRTNQAMGEARLAADLGYHVALLSLGALQNEDVGRLIGHAEAVAEVLPIFGFYLQPSVGGRVLPYEFWRRFVEIDNVVGIKIAPFNRYQTLDVVRAVSESGRSGEIALYTGNDDSIVADLLTIFRFSQAKKSRDIRIVGGLLGHWAFWTRRAVLLLEECRHIAEQNGQIPRSILTLASQLTDINAAVFDPNHGFAGCIPGIHEMLRRQGLLEGIWCLDPRETLSPNQKQEINRVHAAYPHLNDDTFVARHLDSWLR